MSGAVTWTLSVRMSSLFVIRNNVYAILIRGLMENFVLPVSSFLGQIFFICRFTGISFRFRVGGTKKIK